MAASMLSTKELDTLLSLLADQDKSLEVTATRFLKAYSRQHQFRAACTLCVLLDDSVAVGLLRPPQRLAAFFVLADLHRGEPARGSPFLQVLLQAVDRAETAARREPEGSARLPQLLCERQFVVHLLLHPKRVREMRARSPAAFVAAFDARQAPPIGTFDLAPLRQSLEERQPARVAGHRALGISAPVPEAMARRMPLLAGAPAVPVSDDLSLVTFAPEFVRPPPPSYVADHHELRWAGWTRRAPLEWDERMGAPEPAGGAVRKMMRKATRQPLTDDETKQLLGELGEGAEAVRRAGLTPAKLPGLVEKNPAVAKQCIKRMLGSPHVGEYLTVLVGVEMSLHSMEVVNSLTATAKLPADIIVLYVNNCIRSCQSIRDKYLQNRLVRLVCVFLQSLIRNKIIDVRDVFIEVQAFCIEFSRIKEAAGLFRLLKALESSSADA